MIKRDFTKFEKTFESWEEEVFSKQFRLLENKR